MMGEQALFLEAAMDSPKLCSVSGCDRPSRAGGLCTAHYKRKARGVDLKAPISDRALELDERLTLRLSGDLLALLTKQAQAAGQDVAELARADLEAAAQRRAKRAK